MCDRSHRYTIQDEAQQKTLYTGTSRDEAITALAGLRTGGECGHVVAGHTFDGSYCSEESCLLEDDAIRAWDDTTDKWADAAGAFHGEGPYPLANQD